jgi:AmmeMemoRadiSam system protein A
MLSPITKSSQGLPSGKVNTKFLSFTVLILFFFLLASGALYGDKSDNEAKKEGKRLVNKKRGDEKMEKVRWLSEDEGKNLLEVARKTIKNRLFNVGEPQSDWKDIPEIFQKRLGNFVTINIEGNLRGCIGHILPRLPLIEGIKENAINAAFKDPRFPPLTKGEFDRIDIEISILTPPQELPYSDAEDLLRKLRPGIDGVIMKKGFYEATFLPQVWEQLPKKEDFLSHLCLKAGLPADSWKTDKLQVSTYQVQAFEEERSSIPK